MRNIFHIISNVIVVKFFFYCKANLKKLIVITDCLSCVIYFFHCHQNSFQSLKTCAKVCFSKLFICKCTLNFQTNISLKCSNLTILNRCNVLTWQSFTISNNNDIETECNNNRTKKLRIKFNDKQTYCK